MDYILNCTYVVYHLCTFMDLCYNKPMSKNDTLKVKQPNYHSNKVTGGDKQKVMRGRRKKHVKLSDMETARTNKWDNAVDRWLEKHE